MLVIDMLDGKIKTVVNIAKERLCLCCNMPYKRLYEYFIQPCMCPLHKLTIDTNKCPLHT